MPRILFLLILLCLPASALAFKTEKFAWVEDINSSSNNGSPADAVLQKPEAGSYPVIREVPLLHLAEGHSETGSKAVKDEDMSPPKTVSAWLVQDKSVPVVDIHLAFRHAGYAYDPKAKQGLANLVSDMLMEGADEYDTQQFKRLLEADAIQLSFDCDRDRFYVTLRTLKSNLQEALRLMTLALTKPTFAETPLARVREKTIQQLERSKESPWYLAERAFLSHYYAGHPYSQPKQGDVTTLPAITQQDLQAFVTNKLVFNDMVVSVVGDIDQKEVSELLSNNLKNLPLAASTRQAALPPFTPATAMPAMVYEQHAVPQSIILFALPGTRYLKPDFYPLYLTNHVLGGGGFDSEMVNIIREQNGLAYMVSSGMTISDEDALLRGSIATDSKTVDKALSLAVAIVDKLHKQGIPEKALQDAKKNQTGSYILRFESNEDLAASLTFVQLEGLGRDFFERRNKAVEAVGNAEANKAAAAYLDPSKLFVVVVGPNAPAKGSLYPQEALENSINTNLPATPAHAAPPHD